MEMRPNCEKCNTPLLHASPAFVCSYECTFCPECTEKMQGICPNCKGELVRRPRRKSVSSDAVGSVSVGSEQ